MIIEANIKLVTADAEITRKIIAKHGTFEAFIRYLLTQEPGVYPTDVKIMLK